MYIPEKKLVMQVEREIKKQLPLLTRWKIEYSKTLKGRAADILITAFYKREPYHFCVEIKRAGYPAYVREAVASLKEFVKLKPQYYPVVVVPAMGSQGRKICNECNTGYMDFKGTLKIVSGGIYVEKEGLGDRRSNGYAGQSIFSPKAARITKLILLEPHRKWMQKDIAARTGLSKGMVSRIVKRMIEMGYMAVGGNMLTLSNFDDLLTAWSTEAMRRRENKKNYYVWARNPGELMRRISGDLSKKGVKHAFTQEAGASMVAPFSTFDIVSLYVESFDMLLADPLFAEEAKTGFNVTLIEAADESVFINTRNVKGFKVVDNLQLYADLRKNPLRGEKQAEHILNIIKNKAR